MTGRRDGFLLERSWRGQMRESHTAGDANGSGLIHAPAISGNRARAAISNYGHQYHRRLGPATRPARWGIGKAKSCFE